MAGRGGARNRERLCMRHLADMGLGVVVLVIGVLALIHWSVLLGLVLVAIGVVQSGLGGTYMARRRRGAGAG